MIIETIANVTINHVAYCVNASTKPVIRFILPGLLSNIHATDAMPADTAPAVLIHL